MLGLLELKVRELVRTQDFLFQGQEIHIRAYLWCDYLRHEGLAKIII